MIHKTVLIKSTKSIKTHIKQNIYIYVYIYKYNLHKQKTQIFNELVALQRVLKRQTIHQNDQLAVTTSRVTCNFIRKLANQTSKWSTGCDSKVGWPIISLGNWQTLKQIKAEPVSVYGENLQGGKNGGVQTLTVKIRTRKKFLAMDEPCMAIFWHTVCFKLKEDTLSVRGSQQRGLEFLHLQYPTAVLRFTHRMRMLYKVYSFIQQIIKKIKIKLQ